MVASSTATHRLHFALCPIPPSWLFGSSRRVSQGAVTEVRHLTDGLLESGDRDCGPRPNLIRQRPVQRARSMCNGFHRRKE